MEHPGAFSFHMTKDQQRKRNKLSLIVLIVHLCAEKQSAVKPRDAIAIGGKEKGSLRSLAVFKGSLEYLLMPLLGKNQLAITLQMYASIGPNLDNTHRGQIQSSS